MYPRLAYFLGFAALFPSIAIVHLGNSTGVQFFMLLTLILVTVTSLTGKGAASAWFYILASMLTSAFFFHVTEESRNELLIKNFVSFTICLMCIWLGMAWTKRGLGQMLQFYLRGYSAAAVLNSVLAILQFLAWGVLNLRFSALELYRNNQGFGDTSQKSIYDLVEFKRAFAFSPEPSVLALLLLPAIFILFANKKYKSAAIVLAGTLATQSLTAIVFLPPLVLYMNWLRTRKIVTFQNILTAFFIILTIAIVFLVFDDIVFRLAGISDDGSSVSRFNSLISGMEAIMERPLLGWGIQSEELNDFILIRSSVFEASSNIHSLGISVAAWFGIPIAIFFLGPYWLLFHRARHRIEPGVIVFIAASIWPAFLTLNYFNIYSIWLAFGVGTGYALKYSQNKIRAKEKPFSNLSSYGAKNLGKRHLVNGQK